MEIIKIKDRDHWLSERKKDLTSTDIAALFGVSPYKTAFELYYEKLDDMDNSIEENERMTWGNRLEYAIASGICQDNNWQGDEFKDYMRLPNERIGSSFDWFINDGTHDAVLEIKNVDSLVAKNSWVIESDRLIEAPPHIELQLQHQMLVSGRRVGYIGALIGGNRVLVARRKYDIEIGTLIKLRAKSFWTRITDKNPPQPNWEMDSDFIAKLYNYATPEKTIDASQELVALIKEYRSISEMEKNLLAKKKQIKAQVLRIAGDAEKIKGENFSISLGMIGPKEMSFTREGYRNFRVFWKEQ